LCKVILHQDKPMKRDDTNPNGAGREGGEEPPLSVGHLPQMRQQKLGSRIEQLNRRIWGRLRDGLFSAKWDNIHPSAFTPALASGASVIHPCSSGMMKL